MASSILDRAAAVGTLVVAVCAVGVSAYELKLTREQQHKAVWPYVLQGNGFPDGRYKRLVVNTGLGPALIRSFEVRVDGQVRRRWTEVVRDLHGSVQADTGIVYSTLRRGMVLTANSPVEILSLPRGPAATSLATHSQRLATRVCYCSLYDECWLSDTATDSDEPQPVPSCKLDAAAQFEQ